MLIVLIVLANMVSVLVEDYSRLASTFLALLGILILPLVGGFFAGRDYGFKGALLSLGAGFLTFSGFFLGMVVGLYKFKCGAGLGCLVLVPLALAILFIFIPAGVALFFFIGSIVGVLVRRRALKRAGEEVGGVRDEKAGGNIYEF